MTIVLGDLLRIIDKQEYLGQECLNVYFYRSTSVAPMDNSTYDVILDWFEDNIIQNVRNVQADDLVHTGLQIINMTNGIDFVDRPESVAGSQTVAGSALLPSYVSVGFKLIRESLVTRNGYKRFAGLFDDQVTGNTFNGDPGQIADIETALAADIVEGLATICEPVIVRHPIGSPPVASYTYSSIGAAQLVGVGTQNTRKAGRGS